jgi:FkbM family methyltransferase
MNSLLHKSVTAYGTFFSLSNDERIGWTLRNGMVWDKEKIDRTEEYLKKDSIVIDIGANIGTHTIPYARTLQTLGTNGIVYGFEPQAVIYDILQQNIKINELSNVVVERCVLGHENRTVSLSNKVSDGKSKGDLLSYDTNKPVNYGGIEIGKGGEDIEMKTLDSYNLNNISFIKIDTEGSENLVIYGARETITRNRPVIVYEYKKTLSKAMIKSMKIPKHIVDFDIIDYLTYQLNYKQPIKIKRDYLLLP